MSNHLVFVYGTLRRGGGRALPELFPGARFVSEGEVRGNLYDLGPYPGLLLADSGSPVAGEVYEVDEETLSRLDAYEATSYYQRERVEVSLGDRKPGCWVYVFNEQFYPHRRPIPSGDWVEYARAKPERPAGAGPGEEDG